MAGLADADSREQLEFQNAKKGGSTPPHYMHGYQNKGLTKWAIHKLLILLGSHFTRDRQECLSYVPLFFVSVASKGLKYCVSPLFATHARGA